MRQKYIILFEMLFTKFSRIIKIFRFEVNKAYSMTSLRSIVTFEAITIAAASSLLLLFIDNNNFIVLIPATNQRYSVWDM